MSRKSSISLSSLPTEILLIILSNLRQADLGSFVKTNHAIYEKFNANLYTQNIKQSGGTGLLWACRHGRKEAVKIFLDLGADPTVMVVPMDEVAYFPATFNSTDIRKKYIVYSAGSGMIKCAIKYSELHGTDKKGMLWDEPPDRFNGALCEALEHHHEDVVETLISRGDTCLKRLNDWGGGDAPLYLAAKWGNMRVTATILLETCDLLTLREQCDDESPLLVAVRGGHLKTVQLLLSWSVIFCDGMNIIKAAEKWGMEMMELLLDGVKKGTLRTLHRTWDIEEAIRHPNPMALNIMLAHPDADVNTNSYYGSPLIYAIKRSNLASARRILAVEGVDVNIRDEKGNTPLFYAMENGKEAVDLLFSHEDLIRSPRNRKGESPAEWVAARRACADHLLHHHKRAIG